VGSFLRVFHRQRGKLPILEFWERGGEVGCFGPKNEVARFKGDLTEILKAWREKKEESSCGNKRGGESMTERPDKKTPTRRSFGHFRDRRRGRVAVGQFGGGEEEDPF